MKGKIIHKVIVCLLFGTSNFIGLDSCTDLAKLALYQNVYVIAKVLKSEAGIASHILGIANEKQALELMGKADVIIEDITLNNKLTPQELKATSALADALLVTINEKMLELGIARRRNGTGRIEHGPEDYKRIRKKKLAERKSMFKKIHESWGFDQLTTRIKNLDKECPNIKLDTYNSFIKSYHKNVLDAAKIRQRQP